MSALDKKVSQLAAYAKVDDISIDIVRAFMRPVEEELPGRTEMERALHFVRLMLDRGFLAVDSPYAGGAPWPEQGEAALRRLRREWEALDHEPSFADLCWFRLP